MSTKGPGRGGARTRTAPPTSGRPGRPPASTTRPGHPRPRGLSAGASRKGSGGPQVWRLGALALVLAMLGVFLFPTVSGYVDQRREVTELEQQIESQRADIADLENQVQRWNDPDFVERNARERLRFVRPGETAFTILDDTDEVLTEPVPGMAAVTNEVHDSRPWYGEVWESVKTANQGLPETTPDAG